MLQLLSMSKISERIKATLRRWNYKFKHDYFTLDRVAFVIALVACAAWTWGAISSMTRNWELEERVVARRKELTLLRLEVENLELENQYYKSEEYQELAAREKQNKRFTGETMVYLPANTEGAKNKYQDTAPVLQETPTPSNFEQWMSFLFGA